MPSLNYVATNSFNAGWIGHLVVLTFGLAEVTEELSGVDQHLVNWSNLLSFQFDDLRAKRSE